MMFTRSLSVLATMLLSTAVHATVYKCTDDSTGGVTYTNDRSASRACTPLSKDLPFSSIPAPKSGGKSSSSPSSSGSFPRVGSETQSSRDNTRRTILEQELASEEKSLNEAKAQLAEQENQRGGNEKNYQRVLDRLQPFKDKVDMHTRNIETLQREIRNQP